MKTIKVTRGGCGIKYTDANGVARHALKTPEHGPFECDDAQAEWFVGLGVAEYVGAVKQAEQAAPEHAPTTGRFEVADLELMEYSELKKLAAEMGVKPDGQKKADYIAALAAVEVEVEEDADADDDELPDLSAADPE